MVYENIKKICAENKRSISSVEIEAGLGKGAIGKWKESSPTLASLVSVAKALNMSIVDIIGETKKRGEEENHDNRK